MPDTSPKRITPADVLAGDSPRVLVATLAPVAGLDRFQPAGFPEVGHVIYKAPRTDAGQLWEEDVCIVDSAASMANHLESVCMRGPHDYELVDELTGMPYLRCVTGEPDNGSLPPDRREVVVTSLTEGHRIASTYFLEGQTIGLDSRLELRPKATKAKRQGAGSDKEPKQFQDVLATEFGVVLPGSKKAHPPAEKWWNVFSTIFRYDPNALVHGVLFPQWQIKIPRFLTAHLEAFGAGRVDRSGVKFDRLGKTTSGQPIFAIDDATAREIRATFILDAALVRSFGRKNGEAVVGLDDKQKEFLVALALWKIRRLLERPFRFRSGCHLECISLKERTKENAEDVELEVDIAQAIRNAAFDDPRVTDVFWPREELYREGKEDDGKQPTDADEADGGEDEQEA